MLNNILVFVIIVGEILHGVVHWRNRKYLGVISCIHITLLHENKCRKSMYIYLNTYFLCIFEVIFDIYIVIHVMASETAIFRCHERIDSFAYSLQRRAHSE